jgi:hypothetical protein
MTECPWCKEEFTGSDKQRRRDRSEHIAENDCGLIPRRDQEMAAQLMKGER